MISCRRGPASAARWRLGLPTATRSRPARRSPSCSDDKLAFQIAGVDAQLRPCRPSSSRPDRAGREARHGRKVSSPPSASTSCAPRSRSPGTRSARPRRSVRSIEQQQAEGDVLAPIAGRVLTVPSPATPSSWRANRSPRSAAAASFCACDPRASCGKAQAGAAIEITARGEAKRPVRLAKIYPQIENGRVTADVEVEDSRATSSMPACWSGAGRRARGPARAGEARASVRASISSSLGRRRGVARAVVLGEVIEPRRHDWSRS